MALLSNEQKKRAIEIMHECLNAPVVESTGKTPFQYSIEHDERRVFVIEEMLKPLLSSYLEGNTPFEEFKTKNDGINKREPRWGFKGIKGQMFFNMIVNVADDVNECDQEIKTAITVPENETIAASRIKTFASYVKRLREQWVDAGNTKYGAPKPGSIPFFLSYFWQIQERNIWPVYYTNTVNMMRDLNLWEPSGEMAKDFIAFKQIHEELTGVFTEASGQQFDFYKVEEIFWFKGGNPYTPVKVNEKPDPPMTIEEVVNPTATPTSLNVLPESYVPPVVAILPQMALHDKTLIEAAKNSATSLERAFEKNINAAFTILGYEAKLLGQGQGRVPDGVALALDESYAILWDAKVRVDGYSMGTDDRIIKEYITTQSRELKRRRSLRNIYYVIVSSYFADDFDDTIRSIKMDTEVSEVVLVEASALVAMVDIKLRDPLQTSLGPDGLQRMFSVSSILNSNTVREQMI